MTRTSAPEALRDAGHRAVDGAVAAELEALDAERRARETADPETVELLLYQAHEARVQRDERLLRAQVAAVNARRLA